MSEEISIIVPVYNVEKYLDRCIQSLVNQTYSNVEIILIDDGSSDRSPEICDRWSKMDSRIKVIHQKNAGVSSARNVGIQMAQGNYLYFVDSDDWIDPALCEKVMEIFSKNDVDIVAFDCNRITNIGKCLGGTEKLKDGILSQREALEKLMHRQITSYVWNKVYKRETFQNILFPDRTAFEDMAIMHRVFLNAEHIFFLNEQLYYYYQRSDSAVANTNARKLGELFLSRWEWYVHIKPIYPDLAEIIFPVVALCALRLYDRSLWEKADQLVYVHSQTFLKENREKVLQKAWSVHFWAYYTLPGVYKMARMAKHMLGTMLRSVHSRTNAQDKRN